MNKSQISETPPNGCYNKLLVAICRAAFHTKALTDVEFWLPQITDWSTLFLYANGHGVVPTVYSVLGSLLSEDDPRLRLAHREFMLSSSRSFMALKEIQDLQTLLEENGIRALFYKGISTAHQVYPHLLARPAGDIDFLVPPHRAPDALALLKKQGYRPNFPGPMDESQESAAITFCEGRQLLHFAKRSSVDLHWRVFDRWIDLKVDFEELWERRVLLELADDTKIPALNINDLAVLLCLHGTQHGFGRLKWVLDVAYTSRHVDLDWCLVTHLAKHRKPMIDFAFHLAENLFGSPTAITQAGPELTKMEDIIRHLSGEVLAPQSQGLINADVQFSLLAATTERGLLHRWFRTGTVFFRPTFDEIAELSLPPKLHFLYFGVRVRNLFRKFFSRMLRAPLGTGRISK